MPLGSMIGPLMTLSGESAQNRQEALLLDYPSLKKEAMNQGWQHPDTSNQAQIKAENDREWQRNYDMQKEFAQMGIQWRVADAKAAGLHPLAALGAAPAHASPMRVGNSYMQSPADRDWETILH